jgi:acetoin:2,6-dichlorophenolindophenol oxidoreductase subunit beta
VRKITYCQALQEALAQEMQRDPSIFVYGIGVPDHKAVFGSTAGLLRQFGSKRCFDTPLSEDAMTGFGIGAAINGLRPVHIHIRVDFMLLAFNQIANMLSCFSYASNSRLSVPIVIRAVIGRGWGQGFQHSKSMFASFAHIPGLKIILPTTAYDAKGLLISAIRDNNPVIFIEHRWLYWQEQEVPEEPYAIPIGQANILRRGSDITVVATSWMNVEAVAAADILQQRGISVEVIDPRTIAPFNGELIMRSVKKTGYCIVADNDWPFCGFSAEVAAQVSASCLNKLKAPVRRIGFAATPCPTARHLENKFYPNARNIVREVEDLLKLKHMDLSRFEFYSHEKKFKGPF